MKDKMATSQSRIIIKTVLLSIGIALFLDFVCYLLTKQSDLFNTVFRGLNL